MLLEERINVLGQLGAYLSAQPEEIKNIAENAYVLNRWFTPENVILSIQSMATAFMDVNMLKSWTDKYQIKDQAKKVGLVLAGNIPMVGFHDILSVFVSGNKSIIKLSDKDPILIPFMIDKMISFDSRVNEYFETTERLTDFDAVIATGSNNAARYFEQYFSKYPHIIRKNRNAVAVLDGSESESDLKLLGEDVFTYFGLGCRNVSKLYLPKGYDIDIVLKAFEDYGDISNHNKYRNNFDYTMALWLLNNVVFKNNNCVIVQESEMIQSRIATIHYEFYDTKESLIKHLEEDKKEEIQCIVSKEKIGSYQSFYFGAAQKPQLADYADGVDTMSFLTSL